MESAQTLRWPSWQTLLVMLQILLLTLLSRTGAAFLAALLGFWPALLVAGLYGGVTLWPVWKLYHAAGRPEGASVRGASIKALAALLLLEAGMLVCFVASLFAPYSTLDVPRRVLGYQGQLELAERADDLRFSPDGRRLLIHEGKHTLMVWSLPDQTVTLRLDAGKRVVRRALFSPDGHLIAASLNDRSLLVWRASDGALVRSIPDGSGFEMAFSPDSALIASTDYTDPTQVWRVSDGQLLQTLPHEPGVFWVGFDPQGQLLPPARLPRPDERQPYAFSPDGRLAALDKPGQQADGSVLLTDTASGTVVQALREHRKRIEVLVFSPDGTLVAAGANFSDTAVHVWRVADGRRVASFLTEHQSGELAFAPDNRTLAIGDGQRVTFGRIPPQQ
ncbi:MAG TPA: hypothetical protein VFS21_00330 [Roseiflexaceae bacterium]|nr:hypothetical protein [Roseiflexaceae bacterium]